MRWQDIDWGRDDDLTRTLWIEETVARGKYLGATKSGRARRVDLSRRLRAALREHYVALGQPTGHVPPRFDRGSFRKGPFTRACDRAGLHGHKLRARQVQCDALGPGREHRPRPVPERVQQPKDLRDTFASWLLTLTGDLGYVSHQLGHAEVAVTSRHYAKWIEASRGRRRRELPAGDLAPDLLAEVAPTVGLAERAR